MVSIIIVFPTGKLDMENAIDNALAKVDGDVMTDATLRHKSYWVPYIYGEATYIIEGDVWKKKAVDIGAMLDDAEKVYTAIEKNGEIVLIENDQN